jgi:hypothetical protein
MSAEAPAPSTTCLIVTPGTARGYYPDSHSHRSTATGPEARPSPAIPNSAPRHAEALSIRAEPVLPTFERRSFRASDLGSGRSARVFVLVRRLFTTCPARVCEITARGGISRPDGH